MFEVGKKYVGNWSKGTYDCVWVNDKFACLSSVDEDSVCTYHHKEKFNFTELKPRVKVECWLNVYHNGDVYRYRTRKEADQVAAATRIACIHIEREVEEGEGLK